MGRRNDIARLKEYARSTGQELKFEGLAANGDRVVYRAVINGHGFPKGEGKDKKQARRNAAKAALDRLSEKENPSPVENRPKVNYRHLLNEYGQKNKVVIKAVETPTQKSKNPSPLFSYVVDGKEYATASGKTKKEAKEEAAKLAYHEINGSRTTQVSSPSLWEAGEPAKLSTPRKRLEFSDDEPNETTYTRDSVDCSNASGISDGMTLFRSTSEFDSIERLGKGGFGRVFKARNKLLNKFFAIKVVACKDIVKALREVQALCELEHRNLIRCYGFWMDDKGCPWDSTDDSWSTTQSDRSLAVRYLYIQMDLCDLKTLENWIDECNTVKKSLTNSKRRTKGLDFIQQIVTGVEYIHSNKFIHRDLKPSNILFKGEGNVKIGDFGLVATEKDHNDENMERTMNKGTPTYMAPEQKSEKTYDRKVDIFALGLIYFELLWKISTRHEREEVWNEIRGRVFPKDFQDHFYSEYMIIISMLSVTPEHRPEASALLTSLEECKRSFDTQEIKRRSNRTV